MTAPIKVSDQTSTTEPPVTNTPVTPAPVVPENNDPFAAQREAYRQQVLQEAAQAYNPALMDAERRALASANELATLRAERQQSPPADDPQAFLSNPQTQVREIIRQELRESVAPLQQFANQFQNQNLYAQIKNQLRVHPQMGAILPQVEAYLDQQYSNLNPLNAGAVAGLMMTLLGQVHAGFLAPLVTMNAPVIPARPLPNPSLNPSPPVAPAPPTPASQWGEPTEQQRRVMTIQGFKSFDEYMRFVNSDGKMDSLRAIKPPAAGGA